MNTEITRIASSELAIQPGQTGFTQKQVAVLRQLGVEKVGESDLSVFFHQCVRTGLDPFARQIYLVGRWDGRAQRVRYTIQTGIDGYRLIAERTGVYAGSDESWVESDNGHPLSATVTVRKVVSGQVHNFTATAHWSEYCQMTKDGRPMELWSKMPHRMLAKCAEALALRKAFPQDLAGVYTAEEMSQADSEPKVAPPAAVIEAKVVETETVNEVEVLFEQTETVNAAAYGNPVTKPQLARIHILKGELGIDDDKYRAALERIAGVTSSKDLSEAQANEVIAQLVRAARSRDAVTEEVA